MRLPGTSIFSLIKLGFTTIYSTAIGGWFADGDAVCVVVVVFLSLEEHANKKMQVEAINKNVNPWRL
jgi:hypothetical protein